MRVKEAEKDWWQNNIDKEQLSVKSFHVTAESSEDWRPAIHKAGPNDYIQTAVDSRWKSHLSIYSQRQIRATLLFALCATVVRSHTLQWYGKSIKKKIKTQSKLWKTPSFYISSLILYAKDLGCISYFSKLPSWTDNILGTILWEQSKILRCNL